MSIVKLLSEDVVNKIAAGEIVERPANVVKELIENSIDAGADTILIEVKDAGTKVIKVTDNGIGMLDEDLVMAFERHATSKISSIKDLNKINSLGFRGEALPSIASVSKVEVYSRHENSAVGSYLRIDAGELKKIQQVPCSNGTSIIVKDIFYNIPVRKKFLKSIITENKKILEVILRFVLGYPEIQITLISNNRVVLKTLKNSDLSENMKLVLGKECEGNMMEVEYEDEENNIKINGFISRPIITFPRKGNVYFLINRRYIRSNLLFAALMEGYRGNLMVNSFPAAVINIDISPDKFDVNIHPSKLEVKFINEKKIFSALSKAVSETLIKSRTSFQNIPFETVSIESEKEKIKPIQEQEDFNFTKESFGQIHNTPKIKTEIHPDIIAEKFDFSRLRIIGQFRNSFILCELLDDLIILDQHAAHEKIMFETLRDMYKGNIHSQPLLIPIVKEFPITLKNIILEHERELASLGVKIEDFGDNRVKITEIPSFVNQKEVELIYELLKDFRIERIEYYREELLKSVACHRAVKNGDLLREDEMISLIKGLEKLENPFFCPHGRPIIIKFSIKALEKFFKRT